MSIEDYMTATMAAADELYFNPQLAYSVADTSNGDPQAAQAATQVSNQRVLDNAKQRLEKHHGGGWFSDVMGFFGGIAHDLTTGPGTLPKKILPATADTPGAVKGQDGNYYTTQGTTQLGGQGLAQPLTNALGSMNKPLGDVRHEYRAIRDIQARQGVGAALATGAAVLGGSVAGYAAGNVADAPRQGAVLGGELGGGLAARYGFQDSWDRTANGDAYRDPHGGQQVSPGRDVARFLFGGYDPSIAGIHVVSGISDALFAMNADPVANAAGLAHGAPAALGARREAAAGVSIPAQLQFPDQIDAALNNPRVQAHFEDIARRPAVQIAQLWPTLAPIAGELGKASTLDEVAQVMRESVAVPLISQGGLTIPSWVDHMKTTRVPVLADDLPENLGEVQPGQIGHAASILRKATTFSPTVFDPAALTTSRELDLEANAASHFQAVNDLFKMGRNSQRLADIMTNRYIMATSLGERLNILRSGYEMALFSTGVPDNPVIRNRIRAFIADELGGVGMGTSGEYGFSPAGRNLSPFTTETGARTTVALVDGQTGSVTLPSYQGFQTAARIIKGEASPLANPVLYAQSKLGGVDDWLAEHITNRIRQTLLINPATGERLGLAEAIPNMLRQGPINSIKAEIAQRAARAGYKVGQYEDEAGNVLGARVGLLGSVDRALNNSADAQLADQLTYNHSVLGRVGIMPSELDATHFHANDVIGQAEATTTNLDKLRQSGPVRFKEGDTFKPTSVSDPKQPVHWQRSFRQFANDPGIQAAAAAYRDTYLDSARGGATQLQAMDDAKQAAIEADYAHMQARTELDRGKFVRARAIPTEDDPDPIRTFAASRVEAMRGLTHSPDWVHANDPIGFTQQRPGRALELTEQAGAGPTGRLGDVVRADLPWEQPHLHLVDAMANGRTPAIDTFKEIPEVQRPIYVPGRELNEDLSGNVIDKLSNTTWQHVIGPTVNKLARDRIYFGEVKKALKVFQPLIDNGALDYENGVQLAESKAAPEMARWIHNPESRTQMHYIAQNFIPFYFAQEQAIRRYGRLLQDNPAAFRRQMLIQTGLANYVKQVQDSSGNAFVVIPGAGFMSNMMVRAVGAAGIWGMTGNVPTTVNGSTNSLNTIFPLQGLMGSTAGEGDFSEGLRPNFSPLVTIAAKAFDSVHPAATPLTTKLLGPAASSQSVLATMVPNTFLRNLMNAAGSVPGFTDSYRSAQVDTFAAMAHQQQASDDRWVAAGKSMDDPNRPRIIPDEAGTPDPNWSPAQKKQWADFQQNYVNNLNGATHVRMIFKALFGLVSPLAPSYDIGSTNIKKELRDALKKDGYPAGLDTFLAAHPDEVAATVGKSDAGKGATIPPYKLAEAFINKHPDFFNNYKDVAAFFVPQDTTGTFDPGVYNEQLAQGLRHRKDLKKFMDDFYIAKGNATFFAKGGDYETHKQLLEAAQGDTEATRAENADWQDYLNNTIARQQPIWWDNFTNQNRANERQRQLTQLEDVYANGDAPRGVMATGIKDILDSWHYHVGILAQGKADSWSHDERQAEQDDWQNFLTDYSTQHPEMAVVINRVFKTLVPTSTEMRAAGVAA